MLAVMQYASFLAAAAASALLAACAHRTTPDITPPQTPAAWQHASSGAGAPSDTQPDARTGADAAQERIPAEWWKQYEQPALNAAVAHALAHSGTLTNALLKLRTADLRAEAAGAALRPTPSGNVTASVNRPVTGSAQRSTRSYGVSLGASWEIDLWGKLGAQADMATFEREAAALDGDQAAATLAASVVRQYWQLAAMQERIRVARQSLAHAERTLSLTQAQHAAGAASGLDEAQAAQAVQTQQVALAAQQQQRTEMRHAFAVLLDAAPGHLPASIAEPDGLPQNAAQLAARAQPGAGVPASLLARRPDLRAAEWRLRGTLANVQAQKLSFYPALSLTGTLGTGSASLLKILSNPVAALGAGLSLPFLNAGEMRRNPQIAQNEHEQAVNTFRQTLLQALADVENALSSTATQRDAVQRQAALAAQARRIDEMTGTRYRAGAVPLRDWLTAQESRRQSELAEVDAQLNLLLAQVQLYQALGASAGGLNAPAPAPTPDTQ